MPKSDLTEFAQQGYAGGENPYISTSPCWYAHCLGAHLQRTGGGAPTGVSMSRGNTIRSGKQRFAFWDEKAGVKFELID